MTCARCEFFSQHYGERKGFCWALPPKQYASGYQSSNPPEVKVDRPACVFFKPLPDGVTSKPHEKVSPDTPGDAAKQKHKLKQAGKAAV